MSRSNTGNLPELLFKIKKGTVTAEIHGPRLGWKSRRVRYYRWTKCTKEPTAWLQVLPDRDVDQAHLAQCVKAVRAWLKEDEAPAQ
jgi:hypothetical protein